MKPPISALVARESLGGGRAGSYFPLSTPWPSGDHTICEIPFAAQSGITSSSGSRRAEYCGWLENEQAPRSYPAPNPFSRPFGKSDVADLAAVHGLGQCLHRLLDSVSSRSGGTGTDRGNRSAAAGADLRAVFRFARDGRGRCRSSGNRPWSQGRRNRADDPRAPAKERLRSAAAADIGCVDEIDALREASSRHERP